MAPLEINLILTMDLRYSLTEIAPKQSRSRCTLLDHRHVEERLYEFEIHPLRGQSGNHLLGEVEETRTSGR
jgi:hypothetical protein